MSYILDALRRAAQERGHPPADGRAADLLGPPADTVIAPAPGRTAGWWWGAGLGFAAGVVALAVATWWADTPPPSRVPASTGESSPPPVAASPSPPLPARAPVLNRPPPAATPPSSVQLPPPVRVEEPTPPRATAAPSTDQLPPLPDTVRNLMPPLQVGGAMHSDVPSQRMLVLNGRLFHEGDEIASGVVLERIELKAAVLRHNGQRYRLAY